MTPETQRALVEALRNVAAYLEADALWLESEANPLVSGKPLGERQQASAQCRSELMSVRTALARAEKEGTP